MTFLEVMPPKLLPLAVHVHVLTRSHLADLVIQAPGYQKELATSRLMLFFV